MRHTCVLVVISVAIITLCLTPVADAVATTDTYPVENFTATEQAQAGESDAIRANKEAYIEDRGLSKNLSPARSKLSSDLVQLLDKSGKSSDQTSTSHDVASMSPEVFRQAEGEEDLVYVYLHLEPSVSAERLSSHVARLTEWNEEAHVAVAWVKVSDLEALASIDGVQTVRTVTPPKGRNAELGATITEGCWLHGISPLIAISNRYGEHVKVGVVSNGVDNLTQSQNAYELPRNVTVLKNIPARGRSHNEGTWMLEIVHEVAPFAELYFYDYGNDQLSFLDAIHALADAGCNVIVEDVGFYDMPYFEDGYAARDLSRLLKNDSIVYVSAAGNDAQIHYQGMFYPDVSHGYPDYHDFSEGTSDSPGLILEIPPLEVVFVHLQWDDKWGESGNDYDLKLVEVLENTSTGGLVYGDDLGYSSFIQAGSADPYETLAYLNWDVNETKNASLVIENYNGSASPRTVEVFIDSSYDLLDQDNRVEHLVSDDSIFGQAAIPAAITVGALDAFTLNNATVQDAYSLAESIEQYSSRGPVTIAYPAPERRLKPDVMSFDDIVVMGPNGSEKIFVGTSAAAPHIAGLTAALWSRYSGDNATQIKQRLFQSTIDIGEPGLDATSGWGLPLWPSDSSSGNQTLTPTPIPLNDTTTTPVTPTVKTTEFPATSTTTTAHDVTIASITTALTATTTSPPPEKSPEEDATISLTTEGLVFDMESITVPAETLVTVNFENRDTDIPHNFAIYTDDSATTPIFRGNIIIGPSSATYTFMSPSSPGTYFFRCDVHPTVENGDFIVI